MDSNELDPCLAAEARMKESVISNKVKLLILIIGVVLMLILFGLGLFFLLRSTPTMEDLYDDPIPFVPSDLTGKNALYAEKDGISVTPITKFSPSTKTTERPPSSTTRSSHPGETIIALHSDKEYKKKEPVMRSMEILKTTRTSTTLPGPIEIPTTTTAPTTSAAPPSPTTTTSRGRTPSNRAGGAADSQPIVPTIPTNDLQSHPTNIPLTDDVRKSCLDHHRGGYSSSGIYKISPDGEEPFFVFCDMETDGGGWAVVQRRTSDEYKFESAYFDRYEPGFGSLRGNHWLGLAPMHRIAPAHEKPQTLRIELRGDTCTSKAGCSGSPDGFWWGEYEFALGNHESGYVLLVGEKEQRGNLTNPSCPKMTQWQVMSNGQPFSTFEKDRDQNKETNCAQMRNRGAWWHRDCTTLALNGRYGQPKNTQSGLFFFRDAPKNGYTVHPRETLMMLRPRL